MLSIPFPLVRLVSALTLVGVAAAVAGCSSSGTSESMSLQENVDDSALKLEEAATVLETTAVPLRQILEGQATDLKKTFSAFSSGVDSFEDDTSDLHALATKRKAEAAEFRTRAEEKLSSIQNESMREDSRKRTQEVVEQLEDLGKEYGELLADMDEVTIGLKDVRTALSVDMSAAGIDAIRSPAKKVAGKMDDLHEELIKMAARHRKIAAGLSSKTPG